MTIRIDFIGSLSCPFFACDVCGQHIRHAGVAMAAWSEGIDDDPAGGGMHFDGFGDFYRLRRRCRENSA